MTKYRDRMIAKGKETALMKSERLRKEKNMKDAKKIFGENEEKPNDDRFLRVLKVANEYSPEEILNMIGQSMLPFMKHDNSLELLFSYTISFAMKIEKEIAEIKQCLNGKKDKDKPVRWEDFYPKEKKDE